MNNRSGSAGPGLGVWVFGLRSAGERLHETLGTFNLVFGGRREANLCWPSRPGPFQTALSQRLRLGCLCDSRMVRCRAVVLTLRRPTCRITFLTHLSLYHVWLQSGLNRESLVTRNCSSTRTEARNGYSTGDIER